MAEGTTHCAQPGCGAVVVWALTVRQLDPATGKMVGGRPMMVDWPLPVLRMVAGQLVAGEDGQPVPNLGVRRDQFGTLIARVLTREEPIRADEKPGIPHWATCRNPPQRTRTPRAKKSTAPAPGQTALPLDGDAEPKPREQPHPLSDQALFPRRRRG